MDPWPVLFFCCSYLCEHLVIPLFISDRWTPDQYYFSFVLTCVNIWSFLCLYRIGGPLTGAIFLFLQCTCVNIWSFLCLYRTGGPLERCYFSVLTMYLCEHLVIPLFVSDRWTPWTVLFFCSYNVPVWTSGHSSVCIGQVDPWPVLFFCCSYLCEHLVIPLFVSDRWTPDMCYFSVVLTCVNIWSFLCLYRIGGPLTGAIYCCSYLCEHLVIPLFISDRWTPDRCYFSVLTCVNIWSFLCLYRIGGPLTGAIFLLFLPVWTSGHSSVCIG